jgi:hypothetical protein
MGSPRDEASARPSGATGEPTATAATDAVAGLVGELEDGWDRHDADITDRHLAADVVWRSPDGATVRGDETLHAIHLRLKRAGVGGVFLPLRDRGRAARRGGRRGGPGPPRRPRSRRQAGRSGTDGAAGFSEMALDVLVRRGGE